MRTGVRFQILFAAFAMLAAAQVGPLHGQTKGMIVDHQTKKVTVFNAGTDTVLGTISLPVNDPNPQFTPTGDCSITDDMKLGFVTNDHKPEPWFVPNSELKGEVYTIDIAALALAGGTNPILTSTTAIDTALSPDDKHLLVCGGRTEQPFLSVVDVLNRSQKSTYGLGHDCNSVEICSDNSVLVTAAFANGTSGVFSKMRRFKIDGNGNLTDTGDSISINGGTNFPMNSACSPNAKAAIALVTQAPQVQSLSIPALNHISSTPLPASSGFNPAISGRMNPAGDRLYVRARDKVVVYGFDASTRTLSADPLFTIPLGSTTTFNGIDQLALHPDGTKLYVGEPGAVRVYDASTGGLITSMTSSAIAQPVGICLPKRIVNSAPTVNAGDDFTVHAASSCTASATLTADGRDSDGDMLTYTWTGPNGFNQTGRSVTATGLAPGTHTFTVTASDPSGASSTDSVSVTVVDDTPPVFTFVPSTVDVPQDSSTGAIISLAMATASDNCSSTVTGTYNGGPIPSFFAIGTHTIDWKASDAAGNSATASTTIIVRDLPPVAKAKDVIVNAGALMCKANASVNDGSFDPFNSMLAIAQTPAGPYALGITPVMLSVTDSVGQTSTASASVTVKDVTPPNVSSLTASPNILWPPNHKMVDVVLTVSLSDACDPNAACSITSVTSNQPSNGIGDGNTDSDWEIVGPLRLKLRSERQGGGDAPRVYTVTITCTDSSGNKANKSVQVSAPHNR